MTSTGIRIDRWAVERAVLASTLPAPSRLLMLVLLTRVSNGTLVIPSQFAPSLTKLAEEAGLSRRAVAEHLRGLEASGWIGRNRPTVEKARVEKARTGYSITVPASARGALVQEVHQKEASAGDALAQEEPQVEASARGALVQEVHRASAGGAHSPKYGPKSFINTHGSSTPNGKRPKAAEDPCFVEFYDRVYPKKADRGEARKAWTAALKKVPDPQVLLNAAKSYAESRRGADQRFTKKPARWLNAEAWLNEPEPRPDRNPRHLNFDDEDFDSEF